MVGVNPVTAYASSCTCTTEHCILITAHAWTFSEPEEATVIFTCKRFMSLPLRASGYLRFTLDCESREPTLLTLLVAKRLAISLVSNAFARPIIFSKGYDTNRGQSFARRLPLRKLCHLRKYTETPLSTTLTLTVPALHILLAITVLESNSTVNL